MERRLDNYDDGGIASPARVEVKQLIGGGWVDAADGRTFEDLDPFTGDLVLTAPAGGAADADAAIAAASAAFVGWQATPPAERQRILLKAADLLEERRDEVISMLARETGAAFGFGMFQSLFVPNLFRQSAALPYAPLGQVLPSDSGAFALGIRRPVGVVGAFAPWNAALILSARSIAAPLALGNTVVLKPSEWSPWSGGLLWGEIFGEAGLPEGVLNIVTHAPGEAGPIGDAVIGHPAVRRLNFTGSSAVGRLIAEAAGRHLKRVVLELGGYNPLLVLADADLEYAVNATAFGSFLHQGQICMSARRIVVERTIADEFTERLVEKTKGLKTGDPKEHDTVIGPLINAKALELVETRVEQAVAAGAKVLVGGESDGPCYRATLLADVPQDSEFARHETFGPVASIEVVDDADQAVERANSTSYGLSAGIITSDRERGFALAQRIESGIVHVNDQTVADEPQMPFGGVKDSGFGRFGGQAVVDEFTELRWITMRQDGHPFPF
jgi:acyl-CoA reductase-like NAD-dependent aldehyde dehydrogenase